MNKLTLLTTVSAAIMLSGCFKEPRTVEYWEAHEEEAKAFLKQCENTMEDSQECHTAYIAIDNLESRRSYEKLTGQPAPR